MEITRRLATARQRSCYKNFWLVDHEDIFLSPSLITIQNSVAHTVYMGAQEVSKVWGRRAPTHGRV